MMDYYEQPSAEVFDEISRMTMKVFLDYSNQHGYVKEKLTRILAIENCQDNAMAIVGMLDYSNRVKLLALLSDDAKKYIIERTR